MTSVNRGPAAAEDNRRALVASARRLFAVEGYNVPLSHVASHAGVGRASLYRHFPTRSDLAWAVFEENLVELRSMASDPSADTFAKIWDRLVTYILESTSIIAFLIDEGSNQGRDIDLGDLLSPALKKAQSEGRFVGIDSDEIRIILLMLWGVLASSEPEKRLNHAKKALALIHPDLASGIGWEYDSRND